MPESDDISPQGRDWYSIAATYVDEPTGTLGVMEFGRHIPFEVRRVFWVFGVPDPTLLRGDHAHEELQQVLFCARGRCLIDLQSRDGRTETLELREHGPALYLNGPVWRTMREFSEDCSMMVLCDREYSRDKVVRNRDEFFAS